MLNYKLILLFSSFLQLISFSGFMICCLTSPIIRNWGLAQAAGVSYGTFGYCKTLNSFSCSRVRLIYNTSKEILPGPSLERWWLSPKARHTIGGLLISIPVATCLTFISFALPLVIIFLFQTGGTNVSLITSNAILHILTLLSTIFACTVILLLCMHRDPVTISSLYDLVWLANSSLFPLLVIGVHFLSFRFDTSAQSDRKHS
ncbi:CBM_HP2_G0013940.mRNA.1.CDS.1 [Saccharomyces cerevisiae]|nr:CBM_HP2_G0013940.mRNA.1.CDS.1 [Saccharomyces cerevisiae]CAI6502420.1 CBM_HP2_G0013940.mRNA.1.CDS.1 [Saccharomyces cerevisiae]